VALDEGHNSPVEWAAQRLPGGLQSKKGQVKVEGKEEVEVDSEEEAEVRVEVQTEL